MMNRSKIYKKREPKPDIKYNSITINRFIGKLMLHGKKIKISNIIYRALENVAKKREQDVVTMFDACILLLYPKHRLRPWRIASKLYPLPYLIKDPNIANKQAIHWFVQAIRNRKERGLQNKIESEMIDIFNNTGIALTYVQRRKELAIEYEAYVHYGT